MLAESRKYSRTMQKTGFTYRLACAVLCLAACTLARAAEPVIADLTPLDREYMQQQRDLVTDLVTTEYGSRFNGNRVHDVALLQRLLDDGAVRNDEVRELQAMGVILGDLLAADLGLHWVVYTDGLGRSHALRYRESDNYLFPVTMISRRREADNQKPVAQIYDKAAAEMRAAIPPLPYH